MCWLGGAQWDGQAVMRLGVLEPVDDRRRRRPLAAAIAAVVK
jgi:hypothetical protein